MTLRLHGSGDKLKRVKKENTNVEDTEGREKIADG
jgi:hypothetical protein